MQKSKAQNQSNVVELTNDWQQVGGVLGNVMSRLQVVPAETSAAHGANEQSCSTVPARFVSRKAA